MTLTLASWLHDIDPFAWRIMGDLGIRWYGLSYAAGFFLGWLALRFLHNRGAVQIPRDRLTDVIIYAALGAVLGGRLGYVLFYQPSLLWHFEGSPPFWGVVMLNKGGMASHGGMIGVIIAGLLISRGYKDDDGNRIGKVPAMHVFDLYALIAPFGLMLGRLANFINGELLGKVVAMPGENGPWWSVRFPQEIYSGHDVDLRTPAQEYELQTLIDNYRLPDDSPAGGLNRLIESVQSGSAEAAVKIEPLLSSRHPSQLYQAFAEGIVLIAFLWFIALKPRTPGVLMACFLICYGIMRIATELVRLPDPGIEGFEGLSRGQLLSIGMILFGVGIFAVVKKRSAPPIGGWAPRAAV